MNNVAHLTRQIVTLTRNSGYLAPDHAMAVAGNILETQPLPDEFAALSPALIRHAAIFDPFDREKLRLAHEICTRIDHPPFTEWLDAARLLNDAEPIPDNIPYPDSNTAPPEAFVDYLNQQPANANRLPVLLHLWQIGAQEALVEGIRIMAASTSGLLAAPLMAWGAYGAGKPLLADMLLDAGVTNFLSHNLRARIALDKSDPIQARTHLLDSLEAEPFQPGMLLQLAELSETSAHATPGRDCHICLYTWNKPDLLAQTMASVATTDIGGAQITILNNGTTECSPEALEQRVREAAPNLDINWVHLPINVGAPAARNWLLSLPDIRRSTYVAFLDDDVLLPPHWLSRYINTLERFPDATAVGPKCVNQGVSTIQYAFRAFEEIGERKIRFTPNAPTLMDMGQFDAAKPSLTVMGCCHLLHMKRLTSLGIPGFDLRFSPSQVDDIEHDLQIWNRGGQVLYDGGVPVVHLQDTGKTKSRAAIGQAYANHYKMENKFELADLQRMDQTMKDAEEAHFIHAVKSVVKGLRGPAMVFWKTLLPAVEKNRSVRT